jgi:uncharacterized protein (DUF433 family)
MSTEFKLLETASALDRLDAIPGVCGGERKVKGTRIPVWSIVDAVRSGVSKDRLLQMYPVLSLADVEAALQYAESHSAEIDAQIADSRGS